MGKPLHDQLYDLIEAKLQTAERRDAVHQVGHGLVEFWLADSTTSCLLSYNSRETLRQFVIRPTGGGPVVATVSRRRVLSGDGNDLADNEVKTLCGMLKPLETFFGDQEQFALLDHRKAVMLIDRKAFDASEPTVYLIEGTKLNGLDNRDVAKRLTAFWTLRRRKTVIRTSLPTQDIAFCGDGRVSWMEFNQRCGVGYLLTGQRYVQYNLLTGRPVPERLTFRNG